MKKFKSKTQNISKSPCLADVLLHSYEIVANKNKVKELEIYDLPDCLSEADMYEKVTVHFIDGSKKDFWGFNAKYIKKNISDEDKKQKPTLHQDVEGYSVDSDDAHWTVNCPNCDHEFDCSGYFDSNDKIMCRCGCEFTTNKIWIKKRKKLYKK